jgi:hypothetical protein
MMTGRIVVAQQLVAPEPLDRKTGRPSLDVVSCKAHSQIVMAEHFAVSFHAGRDGERLTACGGFGPQPRAAQ